MTSINDFKEYYKTISNTELLSILDNAAEYQPLAFEAAKKELSARQLSGEEIEEAREPLIAGQLQKEKQREKIKAVGEKVKATRNTIIDTLSPLQNEAPSANKIIGIIVIVFGCLFLFQFIKDLKMYMAFIGEVQRFPFESIWYVLPQIFLLVAVFTFWKRKTNGWVLLVIFLTYSVVSIMWLLVRSLTWKYSDFVVLHNLFRTPSPTLYITQLFFFGGTMYVFCKADIR